MRALVCREWGPPSGLRVEAIDDPLPRAGEVRVRVEAAGLNFPDGLMVQGKYQFRPPLPFVPGMELAGVVDRVGDGVDGLAPGDPVMASTSTGAFAELCVVPAAQVTRRPAALPADVAAAALLTYGTTLHALEDRARLRPGDTLLVLGAGGGVGTAAVALGKLLGARVIAAASSGARLELCRRLGADETVDYSAEDLRERVKALTAGRGVDVVFDPVGGALSEAALRSTGWGGRFLVVGFASGEIPRIPMNLALLNARSILGVFWGDWTRREPRLAAEALGRIAAWIVEGRISPVVTARLSLDAVPAALDDLLGRRVLGKLVALPGAP